MKALIATAAAAACLLATPAFAQDGGTSFNFSIGGSRVESQRLDVGFSALTGRVSAVFNKYVSADLEATLGWGSDSKDFTVTASNGTTSTVHGKEKLKDDYAAYMVTSLPMSDNASIYARFGYGKTDLKREAMGVPGKQSFEGLRVGVGTQFFFDDADGVRIDFTRNPEKTAKIDEYTISYVRKF